MYFLLNKFFLSFFVCKPKSFASFDLHTLKLDETWQFIVPSNAHKNYREQYIRRGKKNWYPGPFVRRDQDLKQNLVQNRPVERVISLGIADGRSAREVAGRQKDWVTDRRTRGEREKEEGENAETKGDRVLIETRATGSRNWAARTSLPPPSLPSPFISSEGERWRKKERDGDREKERSPYL